MGKSQKPDTFIQSQHSPPLIFFFLLLSILFFVVLLCLSQFSPPRKLGPRMTLQLVKVESELCAGEVLYHQFGECILNFVFMLVLSCSHTYVHAILARVSLLHSVNF